MLPDWSSAEWQAKFTCKDIFCNFTIISVKSDGMVVSDCHDLSPSVVLMP